MKPITKKRRLVVNFLLKTLFLLPILYFGAFRILDYVICRSIVNYNLGEGFFPYSVENYILEDLTPTMKFLDVKHELEEVGQVKVIGTSVLEIDICAHPLNRITVYITYTETGYLRYVRFED